MRFSGKGAEELFSQEGGGYRWQRISPTEKRGRTHTSSITVAILDEAQIATVEIDEKDLEYQATRGQGPGGQHRNKTATAIHLKHKPSGISVFCQDSKSQKTNKENALAILKAKLLEKKSQDLQGQRREQRREQIGHGYRGEKRRTISEKRNEVIDHQSGKSTSYKNYLRGFIEELH